MAMAFMVFMGLFSAPLYAQVMRLAENVADIGPEDHCSSSGQRHTSFAALIAQDRASYHRFGIRHEADASDPILASRGVRAQIGPGVMQIEGFHQKYAANVVACEGQGGTYIVVYGHGIGNRISRISIVVPG